tara:strand:- start:190 stop:480 length:291 start_codon:yes stop_codon:yes gene_type:complete
LRKSPCPQGLPVTDPLGRLPEATNNGKEEAIVKNPVSKLTPKVAILWIGCSITGAILAEYGSNQIVNEAGILMLAMYLGFMLFGFGIKPTEANTES